MADAESSDVGGLLTDIRVENFRRFEESTNIQLDRVSTSLLGDNGTGKTTVLKSIELFAILYQLMIQGNNVWQSTSFANLLGIKDYKLLWHDKSTDKPIKISGTMQNQTIDFTVTEDSKTGDVIITCNLDKTKLIGIGCPTVVSISNAGVFSNPFCIDKQVAEESASYEDIGSKAVQKINVDNVKDISCLLGLSKLEGPNREYLKAEQDLNGEETKAAQTKEAFNGVLKKDGMDLETFAEIENQMPEIDDRRKEYMNKTLRSNEYSMYKLAQAAENKAKSTLNSKTEQYKETEKGLIDNCKTFSTEITRLLTKFGRKKCKVEFTWNVDRKELNIIVKEKDVTLPLHQCDAGLQQVIIIILAVLQVQKQARENSPVYLLLDEPVSLLHGNLVKKLLVYLKDKNICVVLACHAVDTLMACNSIVSLDGQTGPCKIEMDVLSEVKTLCKDSSHTSMLMDLSKTLNTKCLLVVESEADAKVLKAWIKNLHPGTSIEDKFVTYSCGGRPKVDNIVRLVSALDSLFPGKAKQICVRIFILVDRDYRSDKALQKEQERLQVETKRYSKKFKIKLYCYKKNEQENYLLSATALKSWRDKKTRERKSLEETEKELKGYINEHFEYLTIVTDYRLSLEQTLKQESPEQRKISKHHRSSEDEIGKWQEMKLRPSFTNAKQVLKKFGITGVPQYKELIKEFHEDDIDPEIKEDLVKGFLQFFDIEPTAPAATPQEEIDQPQPQPEIELPLADNQGMQDGSASTDDDDSNPVECPKILSSRLDNGKSCCLHDIRVELASLFLRVASEWIWFKLSSP